MYRVFACDLLVCFRVFENCRPSIVVYRQSHTRYTYTNIVCVENNNITIILTDQLYNNRVDDVEEFFRFYTVISAMSYRQQLL